VRESLPRRPGSIPRRDSIYRSAHIRPVSTSYAREGEDVLSRAHEYPGGMPPESPKKPLALADFVDRALRAIEEIPPEEALRRLQAPDREGWHFVDVREPEEYAEGHLPGAKHSPRGFLEVRADLEHYKRDAWFADRSRPLILYCGGGHRSALAAWTLRQMGFGRAVSMAEGWTGWTERGFPVER
jgi:rhodanese-related sulfurtransferase